MINYQGNPASADSAANNLKPMYDDAVSEYRKKQGMNPAIEAARQNATGGGLGGIPRPPANPVTVGGNSGSLGYIDRPTGNITLPSGGGTLNPNASVSAPTNAPNKISSASPQAQEFSRLQTQRQAASPSMNNLSPDRNKQIQNMAAGTQTNANVEKLKRQKTMRSMRPFD